ncbi:MAG: hypothetical protein L7F78_14340, partial [Syntrophales bacterium LBB04]|nr:hypothetical protein [Syntrophales bacterium LBB04]
WSLACEDPTCGGVPIYRQYLNEGEQAGKAQGIRMMGAQTGQRGTMIANKGLYYIDTTETQNNYAKKSIFEANRKYNFFLIYAKENTSVTFQFYVGKDFNPQNDVKMVRVGTAKPDGMVLLSPPDCTPDLAWPEGWTRNHDSNGTLTVTMDLKDYANEFESAKADSCGPVSFCKWNGKECKCAAHDAAHPNPIGFPCSDSSNICEWSSLRSECPHGGCFGFQVTFPPEFLADGNFTKHRPAPHLSFPDGWKNVVWQKAPSLALDDWWNHAVPQPEWDHNVYPDGPCAYNSDNLYPKNAPLPSAGSTSVGKKWK